MIKNNIFGVIGIVIALVGIGYVVTSPPAWLLTVIDATLARISGAVGSVMLVVLPYINRIRELVGQVRPGATRLHGFIDSVREEVAA